MTNKQSRELKRWRQQQKAMLIKKCFKKPNEANLIYWGGVIQDGKYTINK